MAEAATGSDRRFAANIYSPANSGDLYQEFVSLQKLGAQKQETNSYAEAEECLVRALQMGDRMLGAEHPEMIIVLNDLTRLYLKQSSHASAEPLLLRLLDLKKSKGEDHPEVATVLASLASVRQALGRHESAEELWRHVVDIRDRTLAPNHFAIATALEHLGESCAARGKIRAALTAFERAQVIRERTLGAEHPSVRTARERIADLQLQGSEDSFYPDDEIEHLSKPPERFRLMSGQTAVVPVVQQAVEAHVEKEANTADRQSVLVMPRGATADAGVEDAEDAGDIPTATTAEPLQLASVLPYRDALESVMRELEEPTASSTLWRRGQVAIAPIMGALRGRQAVGAIAIAAIAIVMLGAAAMTRSSAGTDLGKSATEPATTETSTPSVLGALTNSIRPAVVKAPASSPVTTASKSESVSSRAPESHVSVRKSVERSTQPSISIPRVSTAVMKGVDSVAARTANASGNGIESFAVQPLAAPTVNRGSLFTDNQAELPQHARLIGDLPRPVVPSQLVSVEGEVRVRFTVDADGRPVMSTFSAVASSNADFTDAVRRVIPLMRFEPARSGGPDPRAVNEVVQVGFVFSPRNR